MPKSTEPLTPAQVYRFAVAFCQPRLAFRSVGKVTSEVLVTVLFAAAVRISSISETCRRLRDAPCEETYANALYANLFCLEEWDGRSTPPSSTTCPGRCAARASGRSASAST